MKLKGVVVLGFYYKTMGVKMKELIKELSSKKYKRELNLIWMQDELISEIIIEELEDMETYEFNTNIEFFSSIQCTKVGDKVLCEFIKLGVDDGHYKDWYINTFLKAMYKLCETIDVVEVTNYDDGDDELYRAFFLAMIIDRSTVDSFRALYLEAEKLANIIVNNTESYLKGEYWNPNYEIDEKLFCDMYLTGYLKKMGFESVKFTHGTSEFGKDYLLSVNNIFNEKEYYGVQVKAGDLRGTANAKISEIIEQIRMAFTVPYKELGKDDIYVSKVIIVCSGVISDNAKTIISNRIERYMFSNVIFLDKIQLQSIKQH